MFAFSNGSAEAVEKLLDNAGIRDFFLGVISVDDLRTYTPSPPCPRFSGSGCTPPGMRAAWVQRSPEAIFDPWGIEPTITVPGLDDLAERIKEARDTGE